MSNDILRELAACKASDPYRTKAWIPHMRGKWMTVNVPAELWERIQAAAAAGVLVPDHQTVSQDTPMDPGKDAP